MKRLVVSLLTLLVSGCGTTITQIGTLGPQNLPVYMIKNNDFLTANRALVVLDNDGRVIAYSGGTAQGPGALVTNTAVGIAGVGGVVYAGMALSNALKNANLTVKGVPSDVNVTGSVKGTFSGTADGSTFSGTVGP